MTEAPQADAARDPMRAVRVVLAAPLMLLWAISLIRPPAATFPGLDQSWRIGLTLATQHHLRFGTDIVWTYGPLGFVLQGTPDPALAVPVLLVTLAVIAAVVFGIWTVLAGRAGIVPKLAVVAALLVAQTLLGLEYVAVLGVVALLLRAGRAPRLAVAVGVAVGVVGLFGALSKYTIGTDVLAAAAVAWSVDLIRGPRRRRRAAAVAAALTGAIVILGIAAAFGFSWPAVAAYARGAAEISAGYSAGMALVGPFRWTALAFAIGAAILAVAVAAWREGKPAAAAAVAVVLFFAWKHGFVRQDGHVIAYFGTAAVLAALLGLLMQRSPAKWGALATTAMALCAYLWIPTAVFHPTPPYFESTRFPEGLSFFLHPVAMAAARAQASNAALAADAIPAAVRKRIGSATADVLPNDTSIVASSGLTWAPLPVFQGYSVYTPALDAMDRAALGTHGAVYVLYQYGSIDGRYPFGDMPATTVELLCRYRAVVADVPVPREGSYVLLARAPHGGCITSDAGRQPGGIGTPVAVPEPGTTGAFVVASFALRPTLRTRVRTALWRAPEAWLSVAYADGTVKRWRFIAQTAPDGIIVSPAPRDALEAAHFVTGAAVPGVRSITIVAPPGAYTLDGVSFTRERRL